MSTEIIDLACKVKRAFYENRYYEFHQEYQKLLIQYELSEKLPICRTLVEQSKKYYDSISIKPEYQEEVKYHGVVPHKQLDTPKLSTQNSVHIPKLAKPDHYKPATFVQSHLKFHEENMNYVFDSQRQRQDLMSSTFSKARLW